VSMAAAALASQWMHMSWAISAGVSIEDYGLRGICLSAARG
jgi:hypothetical protein